MEILAAAGDGRLQQADPALPPENGQIVQAVPRGGGILPGLYQGIAAAEIAVQAHLEGAVTAEGGERPLQGGGLGLQLGLHLLQAADELLLFRIRHGIAVDGANGIQTGFRCLGRGSVIFGSHGDIPAAGVDRLLPERGVFTGRAEGGGHAAQEGKHLSNDGAQRGIEG